MRALVSDKRTPPLCGKSLVFTAIAALDEAEGSRDRRRESCVCIAAASANIATMLVRHHLRTSQRHRCDVILEHRDDVVV